MAVADDSADQRQHQRFRRRLRLDRWRRRWNVGRLHHRRRRRPPCRREDRPIARVVERRERMAQSGFPLGGGRSGSTDLMCEAGPRSARIDTPGMSGTCAIAVAASGAAATTRAPTSLGSAEGDIISELTIASRPKWGGLSHTFQRGCRPNEKRSRSFNRPTGCCRSSGPIQSRPRPIALITMPNL